MGLAADLALALDPARLMVAANMQPDPWQERLLRSQSKRMLLLCHRQAGKSTVTAAMALHTAVYKPASLTLMLAPALRQSQELFRKAKTFLHVLGSPAQLKQESALSLELANGSRIVSLPGSEGTVRSFSAVDLLLVDEASRVDDALFAGVRPMLAVSGGRLVLMSTPFGKRGTFFESWENGGDTWERATVTAYDCPRISKDFLEEERRALGDWWFSQEYLCEFRDTTDSLFRYEDIQAAMSDEVKPLFNVGSGTALSALV